MASENSGLESLSLSNPRKPTYSQDEVIIELTSFYEFLASMYLPTERIKYPPPDGWDINKDGIAPPINDVVLNLLNRIPYLQTDDIVQAATVIYWRTSPIDYSINEFRKGHPVPPDGVAYYSYVPPHVIRLTRWVEGDGYCCFLDTERGTITWVDFRAGHTSTQHAFADHSLHSSDFPSGEVAGETKQQNWRDYATYSVREFFEMLRIELRLLKIVPINYELIEFGGNLNANNESDRTILSIQETYRMNGWPSSSFVKDRCLGRVAELWAEKLARWDRGRQKDSKKEE